MIPTNLPPTYLRRAEEETTAWHYNAPPGTTLEHVLDPNFWGHIAGRLLNTPNRGIADTIRVFAVDGALDALVTVVAVDPRGQWADVRVVWYRPIERPVALAADKDGYKIEHDGQDRWRVINPTNEIIAKNLPDQTTAQAELARIKAQKPQRAA